MGLIFWALPTQTKTSLCQKRGGFKSHSPSDCWCPLCLSFRKTRCCSLKSESKLKHQGQSSMKILKQQRWKDGKTGPKMRAALHFNTPPLNQHQLLIITGAHILGPIFPPKKLISNTLARRFFSTLLPKRFFSTLLAKRWRGPGCGWLADGCHAAGWQDNHPGSCLAPSSSCQLFLSMLSQGFVTVVTWICITCHRDLWQVTTTLNPAWPLSSSSHHGPFPSKTTNPPRLCWPLLQTCQSMRQLLQPGGFQRKVGTKFPAGIWLRERTLTSNLSITNIAVKGAEGG